MDKNTFCKTIEIPKYVRNVADLLIGSGFEAFLVGGAVRDFILNKKPKDFDIATNATPDQMEKIFPRCITTNARFGTVLVIMDSEGGDEKFDVEVTTYRIEAEYFGGRWPGKVEFTTNIVNDLSRRDFTINAMAINLGKIAYDNNFDEYFLDPFGGLNDLELKVIRAVGDPIERFEEDGLRAYKACRLASELGFEIEESTFEAIKKTLSVAKLISIERVRDEFIKLLNHSKKPSIGIELLRKSGLLELFLPELLDSIGVLQPQFHEDDVYTHSLKVLDLCQDSVKLAGLLHDLGKISTKVIGPDGHEHFYGHDTVGSQMSEEILTRMKFPKNTIKQVSNLIKWHMFYYPSNEWRKNNRIDEVSDYSTEENFGGWTDAAIRRFINKVGEENIEDLFKLRIADATGNPKSIFNAKEIDLLQERISDIKAQDMVLKLKDLAINGEDLAKIGIEAGPKMGKILKDLLDNVIENPNNNDFEYLSKKAIELNNKYI